MRISILRKAAFFLLSALLILTLAPASFAQNAGVTVEISVAANGAPEKPAELVSGAYVNMYLVIPVRAGVYEGVLVETAIAGADGKGPLFKVQPGQIVDFVTFKDATKAKSSKHWTFTAPPYKNFTVQDGVAGRLCQINFLNKEEKMKLSDGSESCGLSLSYPVSDQYVIIAASDLSKPLGDFEVWVQKTNEPTTIVKNATVRLFDAGTNEVIGKGINGDRGIMTFILERERKFYYDGWSGGVMYGGYKTPYVDTPRVFYITSDGRGIRNAFDNALSYVLRVGAYPNTQSTELPPTPTPTSPISPISPSPTPTPTPAPAISLGQSKIIQPEEGQILTNYPRIAKISWGAVADAFNYQIVVECDVCGSTNWGAKMDLPLVSSTETQTSALWGDNKYRARVRAVAKDGTKGPWSDYRYFSYKTTGTGGATTAPAPLKVGTIDVEYRYFANGVGSAPEKGKFTLTLSSDYKYRGYDFKNQKYTSVSGGAFYVTDTDKDRMARFYGNNVGQGGLYSFGKVNIDEVVPLTEKAKYNRFGLPVYQNNVYAVYDEANGSFALIAVNATSTLTQLPTLTPAPTPAPTSTPTPAPTPAPTPTPAPQPVLSPYFDDFIDDFVEEGSEADIELKNANVAFGRKSRAGTKGFQFKVSLTNNSEDIVRAVLDVRCDALTDEGRVPLVSYSKSYDVKPGDRSIAFFQGLSEEQALLVRSLQKAKGTVNCNFAVVGVVDFDTGLTVPDADASNNRIDIQLHWKGRKLRVNSFSRVGL